MTLFINVILLFGVEGLFLSKQKTIIRTSFVKQIMVKHGGDVKGIFFDTVVIHCLLSIESIHQFNPIVRHEQ